MQVSDYIRTFHKLDSVICNDLIQYYKEHGSWSESTFSSNTENTGKSSVSMNQYWVTPKDKFYNILDKTFKSAVDDYIKEYTRITPVAWSAIWISSFNFTSIS